MGSPCRAKTLFHWQRDLSNLRVFAMTPLTLLPARMAVALITVTLGLLSPLAHSASICRWVDGNGRTQMSDVVPQEYKQSATCTDSRQYELSPQQQREAERGVAEQKNRKRLDMAKPAAKAPSIAASGTGQPTLPAAKRPTEIITNATDCPTRWRIYDESVACFDPYRTTQGATKPEGFEKCNDIPSPEIKCGPRSD
jgi:hypothetical protein